MLRAVSSRELAEWVAFEKEHGPVWVRPDQASALIVCSLANIYRDMIKHPEPYELSEFLMGGVVEFEQTPEQMVAIAELTTAILGAAEAQREQAPG